MREFLNLGKRFRETAVVDEEFGLHRERFDYALFKLIDTMPKIICLCGSTRFYEAFQKANYDLTMKGNIVLSVGFYPHSSERAHGETIGCDDAQKIALDELHKRKIDLADVIFILNVGGYLGDSTKSEIEYAKNLGKPVIFLEEEFPRRICIDRFSLAEKAIFDAAAEVEKAGADPLLTDAVILLGQAREKVADYVDDKLKI